MQWRGQHLFNISILENEIQTLEYDDFYKMPIIFQVKQVLPICLEKIALAFPKYSRLC